MEYKLFKDRPHLILYRANENLVSVQQSGQRLLDTMTQKPH